MKIKNTSDAIITLKTGVLECGDEGDATYEECKVLFSSNKAELVADEKVEVAKPTPKVAKAAKVTKNVADAVNK